MMQVPLVCGLSDGAFHHNTTIMVGNITNRVDWKKTYVAYSFNMIIQKHIAWNSLERFLNFLKKRTPVKTPWKGRDNSWIFTLSHIHHVVGNWVAFWINWMGNWSLVVTLVPCLWLLDPLYLVVPTHRLVWCKQLVTKWSPPKRTSSNFSILWHTKGRNHQCLQWCNPSVMKWSPPERTSSVFSTLRHMSKIPVLRNVHRLHQCRSRMPRCLSVTYLRSLSWLPNWMVLTGLKWQLLVCWQDFAFTNHFGF